MKEKTKYFLKKLNETGTIKYMTVTVIRIYHQAIYKHTSVNQFYSNKIKTCYERCKNELLLVFLVFKFNHCFRFKCRGKLQAFIRFDNSPSNVFLC